MSSCNDRYGKPGATGEKQSTPFSDSHKGKKSVIWVKLWIPKWLHSRNGCESIWLKGLDNNIPFDPYAMYQLSTHQDSKLNAA